MSAGGARVPVAFEYASVAELVEIAEGNEAGDPDAPVTLMDFSDYQCPACQQFALQTKPVVFRDYVEEGLVRFVYHDYLVGFPHSFLAARAARCAGDLGDYWAYHDMLYQMQPNWSGQADPFSNFVRYATDLGIDRGAFRSCLGSDEHARTVTANLYLAEQLRVSGTPTLLLGAGEGRGERIEDCRRPRGSSGRSKKRSNASVTVRLAMPTKTSRIRPRRKLLLRGRGSIGGRSGRPGAFLDRANDGCRLAAGTGGLLRGEVAAGIGPGQLLPHRAAWEARRPQGARCRERGPLCATPRRARRRRGDHVGVEAREGAVAEVEPTDVVPCAGKGEPDCIGTGFQDPPAARLDRARASSTSRARVTSTLGSSWTRA
jgi:hypothetical protein